MQWFDISESAGRLVHSLSQISISSSGIFGLSKNWGLSDIRFKHCEFLYDLSRPIGRGRSCKVWKAKHLPTQVVVALKEMPITEKHQRTQLASEFVLWTLITACPMLTQPLGAYIAPNNTVHLVMEYMAFGSLRELISKLKANGTDPSRKTNVLFIKETFLKIIAFQIVEGLAHLHRHGCMHRDLKPENVLINDQGSVKICDFGISCSLSEENGLSSRDEASPSESANSFVGTRLYMTPERLSGQPYSFSADVWSFGVLMYELITGEIPFETDSSYFDLLEAVQRIETNLPAWLPGDLRKFVSMCLRSDPNSRATSEQLLHSSYLLNGFGEHDEFLDWIRKTYHQNKKE